MPPTANAITALPANPLATRQSQGLPPNPILCTLDLDACSDDLQRHSQVSPAYGVMTKTPANQHPIQGIKPISAKQYVHSDTMSSTNKDIDENNKDLNDSGYVDNIDDSSSAIHSDAPPPDMDDNQVAIWNAVIKNIITQTKSNDMRRSTQKQQQQTTL